MTNRIRVTFEIGPKGKKVVAVAPDWPGLERGAETGEEAIEKLRSYIPRYSQVAKLAEMNAAFDTITDVEVVEQYPGTGSTDFWGISFAFSSIDKQGMSGVELERELILMQACWAFFDDVRRRVSAEMQKGPRGGGRDGDHVVRHTFAAEQDWAKKNGRKLAGCWSFDRSGNIPRCTVVRSKDQESRRNDFSAGICSLLSILILVVVPMLAFIFFALAVSFGHISLASGALELARDCQTQALATLGEVLKRVLRR